MLRIVLALSGVLLCALAAFFLFVPPLVIALALGATVALFLTGYALLWYFGAQPEPKN